MLTGNNQRGAGSKFLVHSIVRGNCGRMNKIIVGQATKTTSLNQIQSKETHDWNMPVTMAESDILLLYSNIKNDNSSFPIAENPKVTIHT